MDFIKIPKQIIMALIGHCTHSLHNINTALDGLMFFQNQIGYVPVQQQTVDIDPNDFLYPPMLLMKFQLALVFIVARRAVKVKANLCAVLF